MPIIEEKWLLTNINPFLKRRDQVMKEKNKERLSLKEFPEFEKYTILTSDLIFQKAFNVSEEQLIAVKETKHQNGKYYIWARIHDAVLDWYILPINQEQLRRYLFEMNDEISFELIYERKIREEWIFAGIQSYLEERNGILRNSIERTIDFQKNPKMNEGVIVTTHKIIQKVLILSDKEIVELVKREDSENSKYHLWCQVHDAVIDWFGIDKTKEEIKESIDYLNKEIKWYLEKY